MFRAIVTNTLMESWKEIFLYSAIKISIDSCYERSLSITLSDVGGCVIRQEDYVLDRRTPQDAIGAKPSLVRTHELGQLLGHANFFRGIHTAAIVLREACCFFVCLVEGFTEPAASSLCSSCEMAKVNSCKHFFQIWG